MKSVLITGSAGKMVSEGISYLIDLEYSGKIIVGVRITNTSGLPWDNDLGDSDKFDFKDPSAFPNDLTIAE